MSQTTRYRSRVLIVIGVVLGLLGLLAASFLLLRPAVFTERLGRIPGVTSVATTPDGVQVQVNPELSPYDAHQTYVRLQQAVDDQGGAIEIVHGPFTSQLRKLAPSVPPIEMRGDIAAALIGLGGIEMGRLGWSGEVEVELVAGEPPVAWATRVLHQLDERGMSAPLKITTATGVLDFGDTAIWQSDMTHRLNQIAEQVAGELTSLSIRGEADQPDVSFTVRVPDRAAASSINALLAGWSVTRGRIAIDGDLLLSELGDPAAAFAVADRLQGPGLRVTSVSPATDEVELSADGEAALEGLARMLPQAGLAAGAQVKVIALNGTGWIAGAVERMGEVLTLGRVLWSAGQDDLVISDGDPDEGTDFAFRLATSEVRDFADPITQADVVRELRAAPWTGIARITVETKTDSLLIFTSSPTGVATDVMWARQPGGSKIAPWSQAFVDAWNASATG